MEAARARTEAERSMIDSNECVVLSRSSQLRKIIQMIGVVIGGVKQREGRRNIYILPSRNPP